MNPIGPIGLLWFLYISDGEVALGNFNLQQLKILKLLSQNWIIIADF